MRITSIQLREDGVMHVDIRPNEFFVLRDAEELIEAAGKLGGGKRYPNLIVVGENTTADGDARVLSCSVEGSRYKIADAFVIHSLPQVLVANFYMRVNRPSVTTHFFKKIEEAEEWLKQYK